MKTFKSTMIALTVGMISFGAISISANEVDERNVLVEIHKLSDSNTNVDIKVNGHAEAFALPDLEIGETKEITTESGNSILVTKTESGISLTIDGEDVDLPAVGGDMAAHFTKGDMPLHRINEGIQVIGDMSDEQIAIVRDAFAAAGVEKKVNFSKGHEMRFISIGDENSANFNLQIDTDPNMLDWTTDDGQNIKVIKIGNRQGELHIQKEVIVISDDQQENN